MASNHHDGGPGGVNPLRPYYIPPSIGDPPSVDSIPLSAPGPNPFSPAGNATGKYASKARDIFSDIDYTDYLHEPSPSVVQTIKDLVDELIWKYTSVLMAQPFEVAKTIMQVRRQDDPGSLDNTAGGQSRDTEKQASPNISMYDTETQESNSDSEDDELSYFTSTHPGTPTSSSYSRSSRQRPRQQTTPLQSPRIPTKPVPLNHLAIRTPDSVLEVIAQLWNKESAWGVWKGSNATFIYSVLQNLLENWSRSLLSALFNVPDIGVRNDLDRLIDIASPYPWASLFVAAAAAVVSGLILSPLDLVRTRLVLTSTSNSMRRTISALRNLPSYVCPSAIFVPTILHSLVHPIFMLSTPLVLRSRFMIDKEASPVAFSIAKFCSSTVALFVKLPLETVLRRGQAAVLATPQYVQALDGPSAQSSSTKGGRKLGTAPGQPIELQTIVPVGPYNGVFGTMYSIVNEEGSHAVPATAAEARKARLAAAAARRAGPGATKNGLVSPGLAKSTAGISETVYRRGQGLNGLWRGWKVSWWGLVGLSMTGVIGGGGDGEF
ncbi:mitochondrial carrier domain-containing protein [Rhypophila decipiens]|uniref:Mitochondrial carrier domain-containing protein n=1 Tax=Rhypophila decipiens TaxID=261697 RepID=A0AAN6Y2Q5_9PEZI|nr:mitochondrial carrier domain-containing protein [Rhypophila decipiens]